jgi:LysM repeat protein
MRSLVLFILLALAQAGFSNPLDSVRLLRVKGKAYIIHRVEQGEGLYAIARRYGIEVRALQEANPQVKSLSIGQELRVPLVGENQKASVPPPPQQSLPRPAYLDEAHANAEPEKARTSFHIVSAGETLIRIAQKYGVSPNELVKWNGIRDNMIEVGQRLVVSSSLAMKPYEAWNKPNSLSSAKPVKIQVLPKNFIEQEGLALITDDQLVLHSEAPAGTLILISNPDNGNSCFVRVTGNADFARGYVMSLGKDVCGKLSGDAEELRLRLSYTLPSPTD